MAVGSDDGLGGLSAKLIKTGFTVSAQFLLHRPAGLIKTYRAADVSIRFNFANLTDGLLACREDYFLIISTFYNHIMYNMIFSVDSLLLIIKCFSGNSRLAESG